MRKSFAPGSEAARDKRLLPQKVSILRKVLPRAAKLPQTSGFFKKEVDVLEKVLPQAAKLPGTSGFFIKKKVDFLG